MISYPLFFRAAILERNNAPLVLDGVTFAGPLQPGQILVFVFFSGICGKQIEEIMGTRGPDPFLPHMLGHEGSGEVVDVGPGVTKVKIGDRVVLHWMKGSGLDAAPPLYHRNGDRVNAGCVTTFNEYAVVSENRITPIPKSSEMDVASFLGCAVTSGVGAVFNETNLGPGSSIAVFGCGGLGLNVLQGARLKGVDPIIAVDVGADPLALACALGATHTVDATADSEAMIAKIRAMTGERGVDVAAVCTRDPSSIEVAAEASAVPGVVLLVGVPPKDSVVRLDPLAVHLGRVVRGSIGGASVPDRDVPAYLGLYEDGSLKLRELIAEVVPLARINDAIEAMLNGRSGRFILKMEA